ncbi:MAG: DUF4290 domain-containing protein [Saprospiraceae bacterium]
MENQLLEYNSVREKLLLPEYGRNIQKLALHVKDIKDPEQRQSYVETLIELMNQMIPNSKSAKELEDKLWNHLFYIAGYEVDVVVPESVTLHTKGEVFMQPAEDMEYPQKKIPYRHYGWNVHTMVQKAMAMEEGPKRDEFSKVIASYMKLAYRTWGKDQFVNDDLIKEDLRKMSQGKLDVAEESSIDAYKNVTLPIPNNNNNQRRKQYKGSGGQQQQQGRRFHSNRPASNNNNRNNQKSKKRY